MNASCKVLGGWVVLALTVPLASLAITTAQSQQVERKELPEALKPWTAWATWADKYRDCPTPYNSAKKHICFWPSQLNLTADRTKGVWNITITVFEKTWVPLPGNNDTWPVNVLADSKPLAVVERDGRPCVQLPAGLNQLSGEFLWDEMPQRIAVPREIGLLSLAVEGAVVPIPNWDAKGDVWLKRLPSEVADKDQMAVQVYRVLEDGIPLWLRTEIELTVSGESREEQLGWVLPEGWKLSLVDSPIPVAVDDQGRMKAQVRAGKWTIAVHAFRTDDVKEIGFAKDAEPIIDTELIGYRANPEFRLAEFEGIQAVDVMQTTFPEKWRDLPVYQWKTDTSFRLVQKMRGMDSRSPEGLSVNRRFWLDENGDGLTFRDHITGHMQQIWRLDVAEGQDLGAVRVDGAGQLITANRQNGAHGVEIRTRNLNMQAIGRAERGGELSAVGWRTDVDSLNLALTLPPGWRVLALFGADDVEGDWLTAWSLLDLFLLLIFSVAVFRLWGFWAGLAAFLAFGLAYHEPWAPRYTWLFLLLPLALLRVVPGGAIRRWIVAWKYSAAALLLLFLVPFIARQIQSAIYPQLEARGTTYGKRPGFGLFPMGMAARESARRADKSAAKSDYYQQDDEKFKADITMDGLPQDMPVAPLFDESESMDEFRGRVGGQGQQKVSKYSSYNLLYDTKTKIQTGPAEPEWSWNDVHCVWNGPVSADQRITPVFIPPTIHRVLTVVRLVLLLLLAATLLRFRGAKSPLSKRTATAAALLCALFLPSRAPAQIPDKEMLNTLRKRLLEPSDAYPRAAEIASVDLKITEGRIVMDTEVHAALRVAVPLPGRLPAWSPVSVKFGGEQDGAGPSNGQDVVVCRQDGYLWAVVPEGVSHVVVEGLLPDATQWEWTFLLKPRRVSIDAPGWTVTGVRPNRVPEQQVFFNRNQRAAEGEAAYDRKSFHAVVAVNRHIEVGLVWRLRTEVGRLSEPGKAVSLSVPLLAGERVLTSNVITDDGMMEVRLGAKENEFVWESELPIGKDIRLRAPATDQWVERWHLVTSPVWNRSMSGLNPIYEPSEQNLIPVWSPWPGEEVALSFSKPKAVSGETVTVRHVRHEIQLGDRQRASELSLDLESSLGNDFLMDLNSEAEISTLEVDGHSVPVRRREDGKVITTIQPGKQTIKVAWRTAEPMESLVHAGKVELPVESSNVTTVIRVPESRWILWAAGPLRGPAVRFWTILVFSLLAACVLGSLSLSPIRRWEWALLALGLTQVHLFAAMIVVAWFFILAWRGKQNPDQMRNWRFDLLQLFLTPLTLVMLVILIVVVGEGLLGNPDMFIRGNGSSRTFLQWFQPRAGTELPQPLVVSISVWYYRLLMLLWALWLAFALLRWLKWGWGQYSAGGCWKPCRQQEPSSEPAPEAGS